MAEINYQQTKTGPKLVTQFKLTLGLSVALSLVVLSYIMPAQVGFVIIIFGLIAGGVGAVAVHRHWTNTNLIQRQTLAEIEIVEAQRRLAQAEAEKLWHEAEFAHWEAEQAKNQHRLITVNRGQMVAIPETLVGSGYQWFEPTVEARMRRQIEAGAPQLAAPPIEFLTVLPNLLTALIVGNQQASGKTSLLAHIANHRQSGGRVVVIDPHPEKHSWPGHCLVAGAGRDYASIANLVEKISAEMTRRYTLRGEGKTPAGGFKLITLILDEWRGVAAHSDEAAAHLGDLVTEGRKVNIHVFIGSHTDRAKAIGFEGEADVRDGMVLIRLDINYRTMQRSATINFGDGDEPLTTPGQYTPDRTVPKFYRVQQQTAAPDAVFASDEERRIHAAITETPGASFGQIARLAQLTKSAPTNRKAIKQVIDKFGLKSFRIGGKFNGNGVET